MMTRKKEIKEETQAEHEHGKWSHKPETGRRKAV